MIEHKTQVPEAKSQGDIASSRPPLPPFSRESAIQKVRLAEDGWNSRDPEKVALAYTTDSRWRNRAEFANGRQEIIEFLKRKWAKELDYRLIKELWAYEGNRIAVRFAYEWHDDSGNWFRSYGNENWEFDEHGLMRLRFACINDLPIKESARKYHWPVPLENLQDKALAEIAPIVQVQLPFKVGIVRFRIHGRLLRWHSEMKVGRDLPSYCLRNLGLYA